MKIFGEIIGNFKEYQKRPSVYGIVQNEAEEIAVIEVNNRFFLPGGGIEAKEDDYMCLKREFLEELGAEIKIGEFIDQTESFIHRLHDKKKFRIFGRFYRIEQFEQISKPLEDNHKLVWLKANKTAQLLIPESQRYIIQTYFST